MEYALLQLAGETIPPDGEDADSVWYTMLTDIILPSRRQAPWVQYYQDVVSFLAERYTDARIVEVGSAYGMPHCSYA